MHFLNLKRRHPHRIRNFFFMGTLDTSAQACADEFLLILIRSAVIRSAPQIRGKVLMRITADYRG